MSTKQQSLAAALHTPTVEPPRWLWLWFPLALFSALLFLGLRDDSDLDYSRRWWADYFTPYGEPRMLGDQFVVVELATPVFAALAVIAGICALRHRHRLPPRWLQWWVALITLGCVYISLEEIGYGQYFFLWEAPDWWPSDETDIHSLSEAGPEFWWAKIFNEWPRLGLELFVLYGGIIRMSWIRGDVKKGDWRDWFWPTYVCLPAAIVTILARVPERMDSWGHGYSPLIFDPALLNWLSLQELFFALFLFLYLLSIWYRLRKTEQQAIKALAPIGA